MEIDTSTLKLSEAPKEGQYDPNLQDVKLRKEAKQPPRPTITSTGKDGRCYVDVIGELHKPEDKVEDLNVVGRPGGAFVTGTVAIDDIETVRKKVKCLKAAPELHLALYNSVPAIRCSPRSLAIPGFPGLDGSGVVVGIVDFGCDFRHANFRQAGATRIQFLWDQSKEATGGEKAPQPFNYGRELTAEMIDAALAAGDDKAYETLGYTPAIAAHGTHVMDIAAGNGREPNLLGGRQMLDSGPISHPGVAPNAVLVFVHLKTYPGVSLPNSRYLLEGVEYIFKKAEDLGMPAVVNVSLSTSGGPHDGTSPVERIFDKFLETPGRAIVVAAGNSFNQQGHVIRTVPADGKAMILWHTDPFQNNPDLANNTMEIWYPGDQQLEVSLFTPDDRPLGSIPLGITKNLIGNQGARYGFVSHRQEDSENEDHQIEIQLPHLENVAGPWKIQLANKGDKDIEAHAWIRQDSRGLSRFEEPTEPLYTLGSISCGKKTIAVGAYDTAEKASLAPPFEATSAGPTRPSRKMLEPSREKPELSAPGVGIVAARAHGGVTVMSGTSMAAAHVTGLIALLFELAQRTGEGPLPIDKTRQLLGIVDAPAPTASSEEEPTELDRRLGKRSADGSGSLKLLLEKRAKPKEEKEEEDRPPLPSLEPGYGDSPDVYSDSATPSSEPSLKELFDKIEEMRTEIRKIAQMQETQAKSLAKPEAAPGKRAKPSKPPQPSSPGRNGAEDGPH